MVKMDSKSQNGLSGSYTANLLGNIRSHLAGLQGFDVMALELIQNADDARAEEIVFDVTSKGLVVTNSGDFTYCGDLNTRPCRYFETNDYGCDFHRIVDVGSGGKLAHSENIGRFGIGFVSTYQITDHPEIRSAGIKLILHPESGQWFIEPIEHEPGTSFFLPWAKDPETKGRVALGVSHITPSHIDQLVEDFKKVLRKSLLFLKHVRRAEVRRDGNLLLACDLQRDGGSNLKVRFTPGDELEEWHILRADASDAAEELYETHPGLKKLDRNTQISIGLRVKPDRLDNGYLYAFLPTEQSTDLPLHLNADFFPEADRKAIIFSGHQYQQEWNEMLIDVAATELACNPEGLLEILGSVEMWEVISRTFQLSRLESHPPCYEKFWMRIKETAPDSLIVMDQDGSLQQPADVFLPRAQLTSEQVNVFKEIGGLIASESLRSYRTAMEQLGSPILTLERFVNLLAEPKGQLQTNEEQISENKAEDFYRPLWSLINDLLPEGASRRSTSNDPIAKLINLPIVLTEDLYLVKINDLYKTFEPLDPTKVAYLLPTIAIASKQLTEFPRISGLIQPLGLSIVVNLLSRSISSDPIEDVIGVEFSELRDLYTLFANLNNNEVTHATYSSLRGLPIWLSSTGLISADQALLPGDFTDPIGVTNLLDVNVLTASAKDFVTTKLGVEIQNIEAFVRNVLPRVFDGGGPIDEGKYFLLIEELSKHPTLVNDDGCLELLGSLPIIPTQDGGWAQPSETYRRSDELVKVLGDEKHLWVDISRMPDIKSVQIFIDSIGIRKKLKPQHLVDRMIAIAENSLPNEAAKQASAEAFYALCDNYEDLKDDDSFIEALDRLRDTNCFPAEGDSEQWYFSEDLYAPYQSKAFESQADVLDFRNRARLSRDLLDELDIKINPETKLVIDHLLQCVEKREKPHISTYQVLNDRAQKDSELISELSRSSCIYVDNLKDFVRPNQLYWTHQSLGNYAYTVPESLEQFRPLFVAIGVKNSPEVEDYVDVLLDIIKVHFERLKKPVIGVDRAVYDTCLSGIASAHGSKELNYEDLTRLQEAPSVLNLLDQTIHPDEIFLLDSEWLASFFNGELDQALCKPHVELWSLLEEVGVKRLTKCAEVKLEFLDGNENLETQIAQTLLDKTDILLRLLHDKPRAIKQKLSKDLSKIKVVSYDMVRIQAEANYEDNHILATPTNASAFYDVHGCKLLLARPVSPRSWTHILNALFHQFMPEETGGEISKLTLSIRPLMSMTTEEAHLELTDAGIPLLEKESIGSEDLTSPELDNIGGAEEADDASDDISENEKPTSDQEDTPESEEFVKPYTEESSDDESVSGERSGASPGEVQPSPIPPQEANGSSTEESLERPTPTGKTHTEVKDISGGESKEEPSNGVPRKPGQHRGLGEKPLVKKRPKHKTQWDRQLRSYVRKLVENTDYLNDENGSNEHNLAVEVIARDAVCSYEKNRGRIAEQMPQTHPGYDIISRDPLGDEERYIEVKGISGEWNLTGVGLSKLQFTNAQDLGEQYWLYVVEFISDPENLRVYPICNPANQVTTFMFNGDWRDVIAEESADPSLAFIEGAMVEHQHYGIGKIVSMQLRGSTRVMRIDFEQAGEKTVSLNLRDMKVIGSDYGEDDS